MKTWKTNKRFWLIEYEDKKVSTWWTPEGNKSGHLKNSSVIAMEDKEAARHRFNSLQGGNFVNLYNILNIKEIFPFEGDFGL